MTAPHPVHLAAPMTSVAPPSRPTRRRIQRAARIVAALALVASVVGMLLNSERIRAAEASLAALWMDPWIARGATAYDDTYRVWISENHLVGFQVTAECSAVILLAPLLVLGAGLLLSQRVGWVRGMAGIAASAVVMLVVNQLRLALIAWSTQQGGLESGYEIGHRFVGSAVGIVGFAVGLIVLIAATGIRRRR